MGVIKDGTVSGVMPNMEAFAVHYPGYPSSTSRAVETLGGYDGILKARSMRSNYLELRFRPEDPYSHPALGRIRSCSNLLLKISKNDCSTDSESVNSKEALKSSTDVPNSENVICDSESIDKGQQQRISEDRMMDTNEGNGLQLYEEAVPIRLSADIVARVSDAYHFDGMADYQHVLPIHADVSRRRKRLWSEVEPKFEKGGLMDIDQEDLMILVPPLFSPKDMPDNLVLRPSVALSSKKKQEGFVQHRWEMDIEPCIAIDFNIQEIPKKISWENYIPQGSDQWDWQMAVSRLFDERPIWPKNSLKERLVDEGLKFGGNTFKRLLFRTAYYFSTGPFLRFWIRKGYDPRTDPESRIYQRVDFRVPPSLRNFCDTTTSNESKHRWKDICAFRVFPRQSQISLQLFDLVDDYIQKEIRKPAGQVTCTCSAGWFSLRVLDSLRLCVAVRFLAVYPNMGAEDLLKSLSERFEKSKRMQLLKKDSRANELEHQTANRGLSHNSGVSPFNRNDKENICNDDKDDEDDEDDDDNDDEAEEEEEEEGMDGYESLHVADEDGDFSLRQCAYPIGESISKNYLQELFGSFPSAEFGNGNMPDADISDGEYQIYEQDSGDNENYFDDDD